MLTSWQMLPIPEQSSPKYKYVLRLNGLGNLYFFEKYVLQRNKLSPRLHQPICQRLETPLPRFLIEMPRDHLKTTVVTEGRNMWMTLPFTEIDEMMMRELGYGDEWIRWMKHIHNPGRRIIIVSEILNNAIKLGFRFDWHFQNNDVFKFAYPEIQPDASCIWGQETKQIKAVERGPNGEGTYDFLGVEGALQSRHYTDCTEDDVIGKKAIEEPTTMEKTHDYHRLLMGAFESVKNATWTVVNNRWAPNDLSGWIRENNKKVPESKRFVIEHHAALGGCCDRHPAGQIIFPEEFGQEDFDEIRETQGLYFFSHQYLNLPINPEECVFKVEWLRYYSAAPSPVDPNRHWIRHEVKDGEVLADFNPKVLIKSIVVDPNHAEERGRSRHSIVVSGFDPETDRVYLLDLWAKSASADELVRNLFLLAKRWGIGEYWLERVAGQQYLRYPIEYRSKTENFSMTKHDLLGERSANAKRDRIESLEPLFRNGQIWVRHDQSEFLDEYTNYPGSRTLDVLDALAYSPQAWNAFHARRILDIVRQRRERHNARKSVTGY